MKIGIIGAGSVAQSIGKAWAEVGHEIMLSSRHPENLQALKQELGVSVGTVSEAAKHGEIVFLAVNYWTVESAIENIAAYVDGKLIIDATNPLRFAEGGGTERVIGDDLIAAEVMQEKLPMARVGKAFTTLWTGFLEKYANSKPRIAIALAADLSKDRKVISDLIEDIGFEPVDLGALSQSRPLDPPSSIWNVVLTAPELSERVEMEKTND